MANYSSSYTGAQIDSAVGRANSTDVTAGTVTASKAVVVDANSDISGFRNITATGQIQAATINLTGDTTIGDGDTDNITINADVNSNIIPNTDNTFDLGSSSKQWKDLYVNGIGYIDQLGTDADPIAIYASSGEIDGTVIGSESAAAGTFTSLSVSDGNITNVGDISLDSISSDAGTSINVVLGSDAGDDFTVDTSKLVVEGDTGNVGIGTTSPATALHVESASNAVITWKSTDGSNTKTYHLANDATRAWMGSSDTSIIQAWMPDGSVGIGTTSPESKLAVKGSSGDADLFSISDVTVPTSGAEYGTAMIKTNSTEYALNITSYNASGKGLRIYNNGGQNAFLVTQAGGDRFVVDGSGNVGIGTTSPSTALHVEGGWIYHAGSGGIRKYKTIGASDLRAEINTSGGHGYFSLYDDNDANDVKINTNGDSWLNGGNVGIGTTNPGGSLHISKGSSLASANGSLQHLIIEDDDSAGISILTPNTNSGYIVFSDPQDDIAGGIQYDHSSDDFKILGKGNTSVMMTIDSSGRLIAGGGTAVGAHSERLGVKCLSRYGIFVSDDMSSGTTTIMRMYNTNATAVVGSITSTSSGTAFNTSSDYRLKENEVVISDGLTRLNQLKPYRFNFKTDTDTTVDGFFAHEVAEVVPEAITGEKDAVNEDGGIDVQMIDQSKLVPLLVKAVQELSAKVEALENA